MKKTVPILVLLLALPLLLFNLYVGICHGEELSQEEKAYLSSKETIVFISQTSYPPFEFVEPGGERTGMCIDLARWISTELGFKASFIDMPFQEAQEAVLSGKADVITSLFYSEKRDKIFHFTQAIFTVPASIFVVNERTDINDVKSLNGKRIAMQKGDYAGEFLESRNIKFAAVFTKNFSEATDLVINGRADAIIGDEQIVLYHLFKNDLTGRMKRVGEPLYLGQNCMATRESERLLTSILDKGISRAKDSGTLKKISEKWLGKSLAVEKTKLYRYLPYIGAIIGGIALLSFLAILGYFRLRRAVANQTKEISEAERRFRSIVENSHDGILIIDDNYRLLYVNDELCRMLGYSNNELIGQDFRQFLDAEGREIIIENYSRRQSGEDLPPNYELHLFRKTGEPRLVEISATVIESSDGRVNTIAQFLDITDRKKAEEAIKESEERYRNLYVESKRAEQLYRSLIDSSADAIIIYDMEGNTVYVSPSFTQMFGWTLEELEGRKIPFLPDSEKSATQAKIKELIEKGIPSRGFETKRYAKDGSMLDVSLSASRYKDHEGNPAGSLVTIRDITLTRKLQAQLQHAQRLESIGMIASGVAHNFRNILAGISINSQLMEMKYSEDQPLMEIIDRIDGAVKRGSQLVDELMQFSRKRTSEEHRIINLTYAVQETCELISKSFDKRIEIEIDLPDSLPVLGDQSGLSQVIMNLATNARDAMPDGGRLRIAAWKKGRQVELIVSDTGQGMDKETTAKCFDPFFTTKDVNRGTGLGLSTTYGIIKEHGGDIHAYSELGKGTIFKIYLPLALENEEHEKDSKRDVLRGSGEKILIIDDEIDMLRPMEDMLESLGYRAEFAGSPAEGLEKYKSWKPDAVLLDRNMPQMDGNTCAAKIIDKDPEAKIILVSGYDEKGPNGIDPRTKELIKGYLTKPIDITELIRILKRMIDP